MVVAYFYFHFYSDKKQDLSTSRTLLVIGFLSEVIQDPFALQFCLLKDQILDHDQNLTDSSALRILFQSYIREHPNLSSTSTSHTSFFYLP